MSAHLTLHDVKYIRASTTATTGAPLCISFQSRVGEVPDSVSIFTDDQVLTDRLVEVINDVVDQRWQETCVIEARINSEGAVYELDRTQDYNQRPNEEEAF